MVHVLKKRRITTVNLASSCSHVDCFYYTINICTSTYCGIMDEAEIKLEIKKIRHISHVVAENFIHDFCP